MKDRRRSSCVFLVSAVLCWSACSGGGSSGGGVATVIPGSGVAVDEHRQVSGFTRVVYATEGHLHIVQGSVEALRIHAEDNLLQYLSTTVQGGTLQLRTTGSVDLRPSQPIEFFLTVQSLGGIDFQGIGAIDATSLSTTRLAVTCSGIGDVTLANLDAEELVVELGGISTARAFGTVDQQTITLPAFGFGAYDGQGLQSREAHVYVHGQADATVRVSDQLFATVTSSGSVYYIGSPRVDAKISGTGRVSKIGADALRAHEAACSH